MKYNDFKSIIQQEGTTIVLDTNVILDLARYSLYTSKNILEIFNKCTDLIWIPNQVFKEYSKNKYNVFGNLRKRYSSFEKNLLTIIDASEKKLENVLQNSYKYKYFGNKILSNDILKKIEEFREIITSYKDTVGTEYDEITSNSAEIIESIEKFISDLETNKQTNKNTNNIIFVTNDEKNDWWNKDEHGYLEI